jgi:hypothetical protein
VKKEFIMGICLRKLSLVCAFSVISLSALAAADRLKLDPQLTAHKAAVVIDELTLQLPNGRIVITKPNQAPYCAAKGRCDFPIDCYGNEPAPPTGHMWECKNAPGSCVGQCYLAPITNNQDAQQKILATVVSGG